MSEETIVIDTKPADPERESRRAASPVVEELPILPLRDTVLFPNVYDQYGEAAFASDLLVVEGKLQREGARALTLILEKVINPLEGWVEPEIDGRTGVPRREVALPVLDGEDKEGEGDGWDRVRELPAPYGGSILTVAPV